MSPVWTGLAELSGPRSHPVLEGYAGAFVWVGAQADSEEIFRDRVQAAFAQEGLTLVELDQTKEVSDPDEESEAIDYIFQAARKDPTLVAHDSFHLFRNQDA